MQAGFRKGTEKQIPIYTFFIDLKAVYDTVNKEALFKILLDYELHNKICRLIKCLYESSSVATYYEYCMSD